MECIDVQGNNYLSEDSCLEKHVRFNSPLQEIKHIDQESIRSLSAVSSNRNASVEPIIHVRNTNNDKHQDELGKINEATPGTDVTIQTNKPDITVMCPQCQHFIDLRTLNDHRNYHHALEIMKYKGRQRPDSVEKLMLRRRGLLKRLKANTDSHNPMDPKELQKINEAYELLKSDLEDTYEAYRQVRENLPLAVEAVALNCSPECAYAIGMCSQQNNRWKNVMEDTRVYQDCFGNDPRKCFLGLYDGHHGSFASETAATDLHHALLMEMEKFDPRTKCTCIHNWAYDSGKKSEDAHSRIHSRSSKNSARSNYSRESTLMLEKIIRDSREKAEEMQLKASAGSNGNDAKTNVKQQKVYDNEHSGTFKENMASAFRMAHLYTDQLLAWGKEESSRVRWSGCSTLTCVIQDTGIKDTGSRVDLAAINNMSQAVRDSETVRKGSAVTFGAEPPKEMGVIHLANTGNVQCVLVRGNKAYKLTKDHTANNVKEQSRVQRAGGSISENAKDPLVNGILRATRGLGNHGDPALRKCIIAEPHTTTVPIDQYAQFLILASNGVWEVFSHDEAASLLTQILPPLGKQMLPENILSATSTVSTSVDQLLAKLKGDMRSRIQSAASMSVMSAHDLAQRQKTMSAKSVHSFQPVSDRRRRPYQDNGNQVPALILHKTSTPTTSVADLPLDGTRLITDDNDDDGSSTAVSVQSEAGSRMGDLSDDDDDDLDDEGDEGDIDTYTDGVTLPDSQMSYTITREEIHREFAKAMSERLVHAATLAGAKDNITVMVVLLPACGL